MFNYYNIPFNFNHDNLDDTKIAHFVDYMQKKYITHWKHSLCNSQKLEFYNVFKDSYTPSIYLDVTRKNPNRKALVKLRIVIINLISRQAGMTRSRDVIEFVLFVVSVLKMRFTFCLIVQNIHQLETTFFNKIENRIPDYKHIPISTLMLLLVQALCS